MQYVVIALVRSAELNDPFHCGSDWHRVVEDRIELSAFDQAHAGSTSATAADFINRNDAGMVQSAAASLRDGIVSRRWFRGPMTQGDHFQCATPVKTFLAGTINHTLTAPTNALQ